MVGTGDDSTAFFVLRFAGLCLIPLLTWLTYQLARSVHRDPCVACVAAALVAVNPLMLLIGASIQNDYLSFVFVATAALVALKLMQRPQSSWIGYAALGIISGLAVLTKVVALALVPALVVGLVLEPQRRSRTWPMVAFLGALAVTASWWFVRNLLTYGDLTGNRGIERLGISFPPLNMSGSGDVATLTGTVLSYIYAPVEYYRNVLKTPTALRVIVILLAAGSMAYLGLQAVRLVHMSWTHRRPPKGGVVMLLTMAAVSIFAWGFYSLKVTNIAPRLMFHAAPAFAILLAVATRGRLGGMTRGANLAIFLVMATWLALAVTRVSVPALNPLG